MVYFANRDLNRIYSHSLLHGFAENIGGVFIFVYLLRAGLSVPMVLVTVAGLIGCRLLLRQAVVPFAKIFGVRNAMMLGAAFIAGSFVALAYVDGIDARLMMFMLLAAFGEAFYWTSFHATVASLGDSHARGAQASAIQLVYALTSVVGPIAGGFALALLGPKAAFFTAAAMQVLAIIPCAGLPRMPVSSTPMLHPEASRTAALAYFGDGILSSGNVFSWSMALFITLGEKFQSYGLAQAAAALVGAGMAIALGRLIDGGHPKRSAAIGLVAMTVSVLCKASLFSSPVFVFVALAAGAIAAPIYSSAFNSRIYDLAQESGDALRFHVSGEGGWDLGTSLSCLVGAALLYAGFGFATTISLALIGIVIVGLVIRRSYQAAEPSLRK
ncbi:MFS transporter [Aestuariivirga litoralis]|uniref:MFS transporter n=1 Tax=Aestuariivirga litoralis TaxID=2650924 RepID=UPI0018C4A1EC|nr:MFS transporter [Aestuariivirga litoralis]MBG1231853.1 MFS transporter [Aestuariivirga litoralis]